MITVFIVRCNSDTEYIVDSVAYESLEQATVMAEEYDDDILVDVCGPHSVFPLRLIKESD